MTDKGRVLIIDDTLESLRLLNDILITEGYDVRATTSGQLALHAASNCLPELILLDIRMPVMDGYEVCRRLKALPATREVPVIFVSAASEANEKVKGFAVGAVDFITKPYQRDELLARVHAHLQLYRLKNHLEELVATRTAELREAQRIARLGNWKWDVVTDTHTWSPEIFEYYGRDPVLGPADIQEVPKYFTPESWAKLSAAVEAGLKQGVTYECDAEVVRSDGSHHWVTARGRATYDQAGKQTALVGTVQDITDRKQVEEQLKRLNIELEQRVEERTAKLIASNKELEAFSYSVSHDLRAPLRNIVGFIELLKKHNYQDIDDKGKHYMDVIAEAAVQMGNLIDDILTFSRIGRVEMTFSPVRLDQVFEDVRNILHSQIEGRRIEWKITALPEVSGERNMLSLVLQNLLSNALKFTQSKSVAIIEVGHFVNEAGETVCYVRDNGVGFDMQYVDKLFGLFQRLHAQEEFEGTGVGLANVQRIMQRHGGRVWAEGKPGEGATFYLAFPKSGE